MQRLMLSLALVAVAWNASHADVARRLSASDIHEAIHLGTFGKPAPYPIRNPAAPGHQPTGEMAVVYTPFIRIALAANAAANEGRTFSTADVTDALVEPVVYVAYRWYCCVDREHGDSATTWDPHRAPTDYHVATMLDRMPGTFPPQPLPPAPLAVTVDWSGLARFGIPRPSHDVVLLATYSFAVLAQPHDFAIFRRADGAGQSLYGTYVIPGRITAGDLAAWR